MTNNLIVGNSMFQHHPRRLWTYGWALAMEWDRLHIDWVEIEISSAKCPNTNWAWLWKRPSTAFGKNEVKTESYEIWCTTNQIWCGEYPLGFHSTCEESLSTASAGSERENTERALGGLVRGTFFQRPRTIFLLEEKEKKNNHRPYKLLWNMQKRERRLKVIGTEKSGHLWIQHLLRVWWRRRKVS